MTDTPEPIGELADVVPALRRLTVTFTATVEVPDDRQLCFLVADAMTAFVQHPHVRSGLSGPFELGFKFGEGRAATLVVCKMEATNQYEAL